MSTEGEAEDWNTIATVNRTRRIVSPNRDDQDNTGSLANTSHDQSNQFAALDEVSESTDRSENDISIHGTRLHEFDLDSGADQHVHLTLSALIGTYTERGDNRQGVDITNLYRLNTHETDSNSTTDIESESDDVSLNSMVSTVTSTLGNLLETMVTQQVDVTPITKDMNYAQVVTFREAMGNSLALETSFRHDSGYSWLVDTTRTYQERLGDDEAERPTAPTRPTEPVPDPTTGRINKAQLYQYSNDLKEYKECAHWTNQILIAIETKFPSSLQAKRNRLGGFPILFTSQQAIDLVAESVNKEIPRRQAHCDIQLSILTKEFRFTRDDSTVEFLKAMEHDKHYLDILDCGGMAYDNLMVHCLAAFRNSHLPTDKTRTMETTWNKSERAHKCLTSAHGNHDTSQSKWERFKTYYIEEINNLKEDGLLRAGKANRITEERLSDLETRFTQRDYDLDAINDTQAEMKQALGDIPSLIGTSPSAMSASTNTQQIVDIVNRAFEARLADFQSTPPPPQQQTASQRRPGTPVPSTATDSWRTWNKWCFTHGANLRHNSPDCDHPGDNHKPAATKMNPMGGNTKRDHLWGKWCSPVDHKPYDNPN